MRNRYKNYLILVVFTALMILFFSCSHTGKERKDWLIDGSGYKAEIKTVNGRVEISNGLISRLFSIKPDGATIGFENLMNSKELLRAVKPEAVVSINGKTYKLGGLIGQPVNNYLSDEFISKLSPDTSSSFFLKDYQIGETQARFGWKKRNEWMPADLPWPWSL